MMVSLIETLVTKHLGDFFFFFFKVTFLSVITIASLTLEKDSPSTFVLNREHFILFNFDDSPISHWKNPPKSPVSLYSNSFQSWYFPKPHLYFKKSKALLPWMID